MTICGSPNTDRWGCYFKIIDWKERGGKIPGGRPRRRLDKTMESTVRETGKGEVGKGENYTGLTLTMTSRLNNISSALNTLSAAPEAPQLRGSARTPIDHALP